MTSRELYAPPPRGLRASLFSGQPAQRAAATRVSAIAFAFAVLAVVVEFCISGNTLTVLGISYSEPGGSPFVKFHPATYLAVMGAVVALAEGSPQDRGLGYLLSKAPALLLFCVVIIFCTVFATVNVGLTGAGVYIDTYLSAGALAVVMANASARQRATLARLILTLLLINVLISLAEYVHQDHFIPLDVKTGDGKVVTDAQSDEFRPAALYGHPLTGAMATSFGVFLALASGLRFTTVAGCFGVFAVGLLGFGGRAALVATVGVLVLRVAVTFGRDLMRGRVNGRVLGTVLLSVSILGPVTVYLLTATPVGERLVARSYYDDSAEVRADQWLVFDKLTPKQVMFGTPATDLQQIYEQVGLAGVENPLILVFLNLGIIGTPVFALGVISYFLYLRRAYPDSGWLLLAAILILFSSNSIGVKSPDLFMMTACAVTMKDQAGRRSLRVLRMLRPQILLSHLQPKGLVGEVQLRKSVMSIVRPNRGLSSRVAQRPDRAN
ncbi:MAG: VpsF family polysaccharide biosynthesis protein [Rhodopila sp.]|nr:VpsF family polysaccharide biosynthesis protein [Rhodopila sp.]